MSDQDNNKVGKAGCFLLVFVCLIGQWIINSLLGEPSVFAAIFDTGIIGAILIFFGLWVVYEMLKVSDESKEDMDKTIAKYLHICRAQVEEWIPSEDELMLEELYRRRKAYADEHPGEAEWRNFNNPTYSQCVYNRRKKRAEKMARRLAEQEIRNREP